MNAPGPFPFPGGRTMTSKLYPDVRSFAGAVEAASADRAAWSRPERAALKRIGEQRIAPVLAMKRRCFFVTGGYTFVVERARGGGYGVARVPSG